MAKQFGVGLVGVAIWLLVMPVVVGEAAKAEETTVEAAKLTLFEGGPWKGYHAVYSRPRFDAMVNENGRLLVQPKDDAGAPVGKPINFCAWSVGYTKPEERPVRHYGRKVVRFDQPTRPVVNPRFLEFKGEVEDEVKFSFKYEFKMDTIIFSGGIDDPNRITYPSYLRITTVIPPSHTIEPSVEQSERVEILEGCLLKVKCDVEGRSKKSEHVYSSILKWEGPVEEAEIIGHYSPRVIEIVPKKTLLQGWVYPNYCPWQGYRFHYGSNETSSSRHRAQFELTVK